MKSLFDELSDYYGACNSNIIIEKVKKLESKSELFKQAFIEWVTKNHPKNFGFPDVTVIDKALKNVPDDSERKRIYYWKVCEKCHTKYGYDLDYCPTCYRQGIKDMHAYRVATGEIMPADLVRYNIKTASWQIVEGKNCYSCNDGSFCKWFGNEFHNCSQSDFENCCCRQCCIRLKKMNEREDERRMKTRA
jgi:hypothetical protein